MRTIRFILGLAFLFTNLGVVEAQREYTVKRINSAPAIDGSLGANEWDAVEAAGDWHMLRQPEDDRDELNWAFRAAYDNDNLYMLFTTDYTDWVLGTGSELEDEDCFLALNCGGVNFGGSPDSLNLYIDPNKDQEDNVSPADGYQIAFGLNEGKSSYRDNTVTNTFIFQEAHINNDFGNGAEWGTGDFDGHAIWSFVANADANGGVVEIMMPWTTFDAPLDIDGEDLIVGEVPAAGAEWYFNAGVITSDPDNFLPIWSWNSSQSFATRPDGVWTFSDEAVGGGVQGDFDTSGSLDIADLDLLTAATSSGTNELFFDLNSDGAVNSLDVNSWVKDLFGTWIGDANLDGEFNSSDLVGVFQSGLFETGLDATWGQGDWNGSGKFDSGDFVAAFQDGGFEKGPLAAQAVPEPSSLVLILFGCVTLIRRRRV